MRRNQNVSAPAAVIVIVVALAAFFLIFSRPASAPEDAPLSRPVPEAPPVDDRQIVSMFKGLSPLGIAAVTVPLREDRSKGVRIAMLAKDAPAGRAGLKAGDLIVTFDGRGLVSTNALSYLLTRVAPQKTYQMEVIRSGKTLKIPVTGLTPLPPEEQVKF